MPINAIRELVQQYFSKYSIVRHQIESFNNFVFRLLPQIIQENTCIVTHNEKDNRTHVVQFGTVTIPKPQVKEANGYIHKMMPNEARTRGITYASPILVNISHRIYDDSNVVVTWDSKDYGKLLEERLYREVNIGDIPIMVKSQLCHLRDLPDAYSTQECMHDTGGYFIINGNERCIVAQETLRNNVFFITKAKSNTPFSYTCELRSWTEKKYRSTSTLFMNLTKRKKDSVPPQIFVVLPFIKYGSGLPLAMLFRLCGLQTKEEMRSLILTGEDLKRDDQELIQLVDSLLPNTFASLTRNELLEHVGKVGSKATVKEKRIRYVDHIFKNEFFPHIGYGDSAEMCRLKAYYLGYMARNLILVYLERKPPDDRDHYSNKCVKSPGMLLALRFRQQLRSFLRHITNRLKAAVENGKYVVITDIISPKKITSGMRVALATGNWGMDDGGSTQTGVAQILPVMTPQSAIAHLRRVNTPINREGKSPIPRLLHTSHWFILCPSDTPEGKPCGLMKNLALLTHIRVGYPTPLIEDLVRHAMPESFASFDASTAIVDSKKTLVMVNGKPIGFTTAPDELYDLLKLYKQYRDLPFDSSIVFLDNQLNVNTDDGCCCHPVFDLKNFHKFEDIFCQYRGTEHLWDRMISEGVITYLDKDEERQYTIAVQISDVRKNPSMFTHAELHPSFMFGVMVSLIPFPHHNQGPRNIYQANMGKASIGFPRSDYMFRYDTKTHVLDYPQKPLVTTQTADILHMEEVPSGINCIVAIACLSGFNQEDSVILNQGAIDRGLFQSTCYESLKDKEDMNGSDKDQFSRPNPATTHGMSSADYSTIQDSGLPRIGTAIEPNSVVIGKVVRTGATSRRTHVESIERDKSTVYRGSSRTIVDSVFVGDSLTKADAKTARVRLRSTRVPEMGDKFCVTADHEVLTQKGFKPISSVTIRDSVACRDRNGCIQYVHPSNVVQFELDPREPLDYLFDIETDQVSLTVTTNHRLLLNDAKDRIRYIKAATLFQDKLTEYRVVNTSTVHSRMLSREALRIPASVHCPNKTHTLHWCYLMGYIYSRGCLCDWNKTIVVVPYCPEDNKESIYHAVLQTNLDALQIPHEAWIPGDGKMTINMRIPSKVPKWLWIAHPKQCHAFLNGIRGYDRKSIMYDGLHSGRANIIQRICLHAGLYCRITEPPDGAWRKVHFEHPYGLLTGADLKLRRINDSTPVYCLQTKYQNFLVRRNGKVCWTGNSSRHGQKGVCGIILPEADMPFTASGIKPEIIINSHALPSRMTLGHLMETLFGKVCALEGQIGNATAFGKLSVREIARRLKGFGFEPFGNEPLYCGMTGRLLEGRVFIGPIYYQRLKHMVRDKIHSRTEGPLQIISRAPNEGRKNNGGLRWGEMEAWAMMSHGVAHIEKDRLCDQSDAFTTYICSKCGNFAIRAADDSKHRSLMYSYDLTNAHGHYCRICDTGEFVIQKTIPYGFKLLNQELEGCHIGVGINLSS